VFDGDGFLTRMRARDLEDTLFGHMEIEVAVRFGFVDAPELDQPGGREAKEFLTDLIGGRSVRIEILTKMNTGKSVDRHGRLVCVPYLEQQYEHLTLATPSGHRHLVGRFRQPITLTRNVELEMVLNGWAWVMDRYEPDARYHEALNEARRNRRGIWAMSDNVDPWTFKRDKALAARRNGQTRDERAAVDCLREACGGRLVRRNGRFGDFLGCSRFPQCNFSRSLAAD
jgi:endonuclease YncB( thermonuclease family)